MSSISFPLTFQLPTGAAIGFPNNYAVVDGVIVGRQGNPSFVLDGRATIVPYWTKGSPTPTYTRATTATVTDFEGRLVTVPSGCARDQGGRFVQNLVATSSENFTAVGWGNVGGTVTVGYGTPPAGYASANRFVTTITGQRVGQFGTVGVIAGHTYRVTFMVKSNTTPVSYNILTQPTYGVDVQVPITITTDWTKVSAQWVCAGVQTSYALWSTSASDISCTGALLEEVTGQSNQNPSEYVSVGVLSAPYHGWGADGCKWFTYQNGNTVASNVVAEAQGAAITPDGYLSEPAGTNLCLQSNAFTTTWTASGATAQDVVGPTGVANSAWTLTGTGVQTVIQGIAITAATYTASIFVKKTSGATGFPLLRCDFSPLAALCTIDTNNGVATVWTQLDGGWTIQTSSAVCTSFSSNYWRVSLTFLATAATWVIRYYPLATTNATQSTGSIGGATGSSIAANAQLEIGPVASSYIATTTAAVTRNADIDRYVTSGNIPASGAFVIAGEFTSNISGGSTNRIQLSCGSDLNNYIEVGGLSDSTFRFTRNIAASATQALIAHTPVAGTTYKWCVRYSTVTGLDVWLNGTKGTNSATTTQPILGTNIFYGARLDSLLQPYAALANTTIYATDLSDSQCAALSS